MDKDIAQIEPHITKYVGVITKAYNTFMKGDDEHRTNMRQKFVDETDIVHGKKYTKLVINGNAHSFIVNNEKDAAHPIGAVLRAKSANAPNRTKAVGSIFDAKFIAKGHWHGV